MNRNFLMAVGIAAMDGLLCAFVAVLALAFLLQGEPKVSQGGAPAGTLAVEVSWKASMPGTPYNNLVLGVHAERPACPDSRYFPLNIGELRASADPSPSACTIQATWIGCAKAEGECTAWLVLRNVEPGTSIDTTFYIAGTDRAELLAADEIVLTTSVYFDSRSRPIKHDDGPRLKLQDVDGATLSLQINGEGRVRSRWVPHPNEQTG